MLTREDQRHIVWVRPKEGAGRPCGSSKVLRAQIHVHRNCQLGNEKALVEGEVMRGQRPYWGRVKISPSQMRGSVQYSRPRPPNDLKK